MLSFARTALVFAWRMAPTGTAGLECVKGVLGLATHGNFAKHMLKLQG